MARASTSFLVVVMAACLAVLCSAQGLGYVPTSCPTGPQGLATVVSASSNTNVYGQAYISGSVVITNGGQANVPLDKVQVMLANSAVVAPMFLTANCPIDYVPFNPMPWQLGQVTCEFTAMLPTNGPATKPSSWPTVMATVSVEGGSKCPTAHANIQHQGSSPPLVMGRKLKAGQ